MILASIAPVEITPREGKNLQDGNYNSQDEVVTTNKKIEFLTNLELYVINGLHNHIICGLDFPTLTRCKLNLANSTVSFSDDLIMLYLCSAEQFCMHCSVGWCI